MYKLNEGCYPSTINPNGKFLKKEDLQNLPNGIYVTSPLHGPRVYSHDRRVMVDGDYCYLITAPNIKFKVSDFFKYNVVYYPNIYLKR
ncbi:hypothetical protein CDGHABPJ_00264 [Pseudomonas phage OMKO1]|nr:hypothetical protein CDGHABPJ_00264 [Pseudomonas phage OMKO1]WNV47808.1 hypothetical protein [Pseudomonas phage fMGyn-Pae01]